MKRTITFYLFSLTTILTFGQTFDFNTPGDVEGWNDGGATATVVTESGRSVMQLACAHKNPNIKYTPGFDTSGITHMHITLKNNTLGVSATALKVIFAKASGSGNTFINTTISTADTAYKTYDVELAGEDGWTGTITNNLTLRFSLDGDQVVNGNIYIDQIVFDNQAVLSSAKVENRNINFYPNPSNDFVNISAERNISLINVYNLSGAKVLTTQNNTKTARIRVDGLTEGVYAMEIISGGNSSTYKFVKN